MVHQLYRALDFLAVWSEEIERDVFLRSADLLRLDVDLDLLLHHHGILRDRRTRRAR